MKRMLLRWQMSSLMKRSFGEFESFFLTSEAAESGL